MAAIPGSSNANDLGNDPEQGDFKDDEPQGARERRERWERTKERTKQFATMATDKTKERLALEGQLRQALLSLQTYINPKYVRDDVLIPKWVLARSQGIVFLTVIKAGFIFAGNVGTGCIIARKDDGTWTGPSSIGVAGVSFGLLAGASKVDYIFVLPDRQCVRAFMSRGQLRLGGEFQLTAGPIGRDASGSAGIGDRGGPSIIFSYSHSKGLYGGLALDGKMIGVRPICNRGYYGAPVKVEEILTGAVEPPPNEHYDMLTHLLDSYVASPGGQSPHGERLSPADIQSLRDDDEQNAPPPQGEPTPPASVTVPINLAPDRGNASDFLPPQ